MPQLTSYLRPYIIVIFLSLGLSACGGGDGDGSNAPPPSSQATEFFGNTGGSQGNSFGNTGSSQGNLSRPGNNNANPTYLPNLDPDQLLIVTLSPSNLDFPNPERGFYRPTYGPHNMREETLSNYARAGHRVVHIRSNLQQYVNQDIPSNILNSMREGMSYLRNSGLKGIFKFYYYESGGSDPSLAQVKRHIAQIGSVLKEHEDVIALVEMGFIGPWGEGYASSNGNHNPGPKAEIRDALLAAVPSSRQIAARYPQDLVAWFPQAPTLNDLLSLNPKPTARMGFHNDCFLAAENDLTYRDYKDSNTPNPNSRERAAMKIRTGFTVSGGETCNPQRTARMSCQNIMSEGAAYHMDYLNIAFHADFINGWEQQGCLADVYKNLGYRLQVNEVALSKVVANNRQISWSINISNKGWSRPMNSRYLVLRLVNRTGAYDITLPDTDLRRLSSSSSINFNGARIVDRSIPSGKYNVMLGAPDISTKLRDRPVYSIRFANSDDTKRGIKWNPADGFMDLGVAVTIQ